VQNYLYSSPNIIRATKSRRMKWAGCITRVGGEERCSHGFGGETRGKEPLGRPRRNGSIILKWIFNKRDEGMDWIGLAQNTDRWRTLVIEVMNLRFP